MKKFFRVWAPRASRVDLKILRPGKSPQLITLESAARGYFQVLTGDVRPGDRYVYVLDGKKERPDPVSRHQPDGVHGPSMVVDELDFRWTDRHFNAPPFSKLIFYEIHVGTFTSSGTFEGVIQKLPYLKKLGVNCLEIMPVAQFPGKRNWGYDGVGLYAVHNGYGGVTRLKNLVNACHRHGIAVCLDVVYNHLGPEGNYLHDFGPYFTAKYHTPWGDALNFDGPDSDAVREFVIENAVYWVKECHIDALRLDAIHGIFDFSARHILEELADRVREGAKKIGRTAYLIAESDLNDSRFIRPKAQGGCALDAQWSDDFHHAAHTLLTGERNGYYEDFGRLEDLHKALTEGFVYDGRYSPFRRRRHGNTVKDLPRATLVASIQNHDQVGNRAFGDRFGTLLSLPSQKLAASILLLSPFTPLLFMGEEYGEKAPFLYFVDHGDAELRRAVRDGRKKEFESFGWGDAPDPESKRTFLRSKLDWKLSRKIPHRFLWTLYRDLILIRKGFISPLPKNSVRRCIFSETGKWLVLEYQRGPRGRLGVFFSFSEESRRLANPFKSDSFKIIIRTDAAKYGGPRRREISSLRGELLMGPRSALIANLS